MHQGTSPGGWRSASAAPIYSAQHGLAGAVSLFSDTTLLHDLQERLQDLVHAVSHDLRTPLQTVQLHAEHLSRLMESGAPGEQGPRSAAVIAQCARQMGAMIGDLVEFVRLGSGQVNPAKEPLALGAFVAELLDRTRGIIDAARVHVDIPADLPSVLADPSHLERILVNLLSNGLKYSTPDTALALAAHRAGAEVAVSVTDRGPGIAPEDLPHVFERFYRTRSARKTEGLGLGLYITKSLVEAQGGTIGVESKPGEGSTFYVNLPVA